jgi:hypothetical protein
VPALGLTKPIKLFVLVMLPVAVINPAVVMLPPDTLPVAATVAADTAATDTKLPPLMLPVAVINPAVLTLPPVMLPVALKVVPATTVVTDVMLLAATTLAEIPSKKLLLTVQAVSVELYVYVTPLTLAFCPFVGPTGNVIGISLLF